jgi:predicted metal-dependent phosphoesterase TrpH
LIDLHTHSTASDGKLEPAELVRKAAEVGITLLALTDHDTLSGLSEAAEEAARLGITFVPGIEISAEYGPGSMHILGYFVDQDHQEFNQRLEKLREARDSRNDRIIEKLAELGCPLDPQEVASLAKGESMGRPHIANAMVARGYVSSFKEAFDRYLGKEGAAYMGRERMTQAESIRIIHAAGGLAVLAHPQTLKLDEEGLKALFAELSGLGLDGVEVYYYSHTPEEVELYRSLARQSGLLVTGGTDFHGPGMVETELGVGQGDMTVPPSVAEELFAARRGV